MQVEIETLDRQLAFDIIESDRLKAGTTRNLPGGATLTFEKTYTGKTFGAEVVVLGLDFGVGVVSGVVANWLFQKLKGRATKLRIDRTEIEVEEAAIKRDRNTYRVERLIVSASFAAAFKRRNPPCPQLFCLSHWLSRY
ncbi:MAG: hypothetical protein ACREBG_28485 [Pyrinomonadaceae bacterium]